MAKRRKGKYDIDIDDIEFIDKVFAYNRTKKRFQYDCKLYEKEGKWYWSHTDTYCRDIRESEKEYMKNYLDSHK